MPKPDYTALTFPGPPPDRPYVIVNMISSVDGKVTIEGTEQGIGSEVDQRLMRELRFHADAIMDGAGTFRASGISSRLNDPYLVQRRVEAGRTPLPIATTITQSGNLPLDRAFFTADDFEAIVFAAPGMPAANRRALGETGRRIVDLPEEDPIRWMLRCLREEFDCALLLLEGGPDSNRSFLDVDAVDEMFLTIGPVIVGERHGLSAVGGTEPYMRDQVRHLELVHAVPNEDTNELYLRYRVMRG